MATHDDLNTPAIAVVGFVGAIVVLAIILLLMIVFHQVEARQERRRAEDVDKVYMQVSDLVTKQEGKLADYGWVSQEKGIARIPITRAMDLVVADLSRDSEARVTGAAEAVVEPPPEEKEKKDEKSEKEDENAP